jgi:hypothetical protein
MTAKLTSVNNSFASASLDTSASYRTVTVSCCIIQESQGKCSPISGTFYDNTSMRKDLSTINIVYY